MTDNPTIVLAGKEYSVPPLVPKQLKYVVPAIMQTGAALIDIRGITTDTFTKLLEIIYWGIIWPNDPNRGDPKLSIKFPSVEEMDIGLDDMMAAVKLVQRQTGLFKKLPVFSISWDDLLAAAAEWRTLQKRHEIDEINPINNEDIQGALGLLVAKSAKGADSVGEAQATN